MEIQKTLDRYHESGSNADFEKIVQAYGSFVFNIARRNIYNKELAEEIVQEVFIILARKASQVREAGKLAAWLHRTTLHCCANMNRKESRRLKTMNAYSQQIFQETAFSKAEEEQWRNVVPLLDHAINKLTPGDRAAVMLRFYEKYSFKQIAQLVGKSEEASRKQVSRALKKLAKLMKKKGVAVPATMLATGLGTHLCRGTLHLTGGQITQLATVAKASVNYSFLTQTVAIMSGYKLTIAAASIVALIPISIQWQENRKGANLANKHSLQGLPSPSKHARIAHHANAFKPRTREELVAAIQEILILRNPFRREAKSDQFMVSLRKGELHTVLSLLESPLVNESQLTLNEKPGLWRQLFARWVRLDPETATAIVDGIDTPNLKHSAMYGIVEGWVGTNPKAAKDYLENLPPSSLRTSLLTFSWSRHAYEDPEGATRMAMRIKDSSRKIQVIQTIMDAYGDQNPLAGITQLKSYEEGIDKQRWMSSLLKKLSKSKPHEAFSKTIQLTSENQQRHLLPPIMTQWAKIDPDGGLKVLTNIPEKIRHGKIFESFGHGLVEIDQIDHALKKLENEEEQSALVAGAMKGYYYQPRKFVALTPGKITHLQRLIEGLPPGSFQASAEWHFAASWARLNSSAATHWLHQSTNHSNSMKAKFSRHYAR